MSIPGVRSVPPAAKGVGIPATKRTSFHFKMNKQFYGILFVGLAILLGSMSFSQHDKYADKLWEAGIAALFSGSGLVMAGRSKSDEEQEENLHAEIRRKSGQFEAYVPRNEEF